VTCAPQDDVHAVMVRLGQSLSFPCYYGANLDALYDCLTDFELPEQGTSLMVLIEDLPVGAHLSARQLVALRKVLRDARADWAARGKDLAVAYSVRLAAT
jgi:RNAse (barnase) inhibitor barstar